MPVLNVPVEGKTPRRSHFAQSHHAGKQKPPFLCTKTFETEEVELYDVKAGGTTSKMDKIETKHMLKNNKVLKMIRSGTIS